jgi:hypothetical protein
VEEVFLSAWRGLLDLFFPVLDLLMSDFAPTIAFRRSASKGRESFYAVQFNAILSVAKPAVTDRTAVKITDAPRTDKPFTATIVDVLTDLQHRGRASRQAVRAC